MDLDLIKLSKTVAHALRHKPGAYNLTLDKEGWVAIADLLQALRSKGWAKLQEEHLIQMIARSEKKRFQLLPDKIRACYGHSTAGKIEKQQQVPPLILYHGTSLSKISSILKLGLLPMNRQYVHLSEDTATAEIVASRRKEQVKILTIQALQAFEHGVCFYKEENGIWLSDPVPPQYIQA